VKDKTTVGSKALKEGIGKVLSDLDKGFSSNSDGHIRKTNKKLIGLICVFDGQSTSIIKIKKLKPNMTHFKLNDKEYPFDINKHLFTTKSKTTYIFDINKGQLHLDYGDVLKFDQKFLKMIVRSKIIAQTFVRFTGQQARNTMYIAFFFAVFGGLIGFISALIGYGLI